MEKKDFIHTDWATDQSLLMGKCTFSEINDCQIKTRNVVRTIPEFFAGQKVLVTGGTGFMGKVLVEKILRSCPQVSCIYLLLREKKGKTIEERWKAITELPLFDKLKQQEPSALDKVVLIPSDLMRDDLGLSEEHCKLIVENTTLIYHGAAVIQFNESITQCLEMNTKLTHSFLKLARLMKNLKVFTYLSTAYCNFNRPIGECIEEILPASQDWKAVLKLLETEPKVIASLSNKLLAGHPNAYTWSKNLTEQVVKDFSCYFPTVIMRPGVVLGTIHEDPIKGWADSLNYMTGLIYSALVGVMRVWHDSLDSHQDIVHVDIAARALMVAAKKAHETCDEGKGSIQVYNCSYGEDLKFTNYDLLKSLHPGEKYPAGTRVWSSQPIIQPNPVLHFILFLIWQLSLDVIMDTILVIIGRERMFLKTSKKFINVARTAKSLLRTQISFPREKFKDLENYILNEDKQQFSLDVLHLNSVKERTDDLLLGFCKYVLKQDLSEESIEKMKKDLVWTKIWTMSITTLYYCIFGYILFGLGKYWYLRYL